jgi:hypothetical protein
MSRRAAAVAALAVALTTGAAAGAQAATNRPPSVRITSPVYDTVNDVSPTVKEGQTFTVRTSDRDGKVVRVEWYFVHSVYYGSRGSYDEPLGVSTTSPFSFTFKGPARLYIGGSLLARAYDDKGAATDSATVPIVLRGSQGRVTDDVRFALGYVNEAEWGTARQSDGTAGVYGPDTSEDGTSVSPVKAISPRFLGYSGDAAVRFKAAGAFVQWPVKLASGDTVDTVAAGTYRFTWRYDNPFGATRTLRLTTGGSTQSVYSDQSSPVDQGTVSFPATALPTTQLAWKTVSVDVTLPAGRHNVRLTSTDGTGPLVDYLVVTKVG